MARNLTTGAATVIRDTDMMQTGIQARLLDVSTRGVRLLMAAPLDLNEQVRLVVRNEIQRLEKTTRGTVRRVAKTDDGGHVVDFELMLRLAPLEVLLLRKLLNPDNVRKILPAR